jgi:threonine dehydrogenase-like Zn-dependent dehydrogenase
MAPTWSCAQLRTLQSCGHRLRIRWSLTIDTEVHPPKILLITHHFQMDEFEKAYDVFGRSSDTGALKVVLERD